MELLTVEGGSTANITLVELNSGDTKGTLLATLPDLQVKPGDFIVLHFNPTTETDESISKSECTSSTCCASAWDVNASTTGILFSNVVLLLEDSNQAALDAVAFVKGSSTTVVDYPLAVQYVQSLGEWSPADCGGSLCTYAGAPTVNQISMDWSLVTTTTSAARKVSADTDSAIDWLIGTSSFGAANQ